MSSIPTETKFLRLPEPVVVLGAGGFIGSNLVKRLVADGYTVSAVDRRFPPFRAEAWKGATTVSADLRYEEAVELALEGAGTVFHLAADMGGVGYFHSDADFRASTDNGKITLNVLRACAKFNVGRVFYACSACAYPVEFQQGNPAPLLEEDQVGRGTPDALYGAEKLQGLRISAKLANARVGILHTVYGPLQEHSGRRMKFPSAVSTKALASKETGVLEVWGDGSQLRSYCYIDDAVERIIRIASADVYEGPVNVGSTGAITCNEVAQLCLNIVDSDATIVNVPSGPTGVTARDCSNTKFNSLYGEVPQTDYSVGFEKFIDWLSTFS